MTNDLASRIFHLSHQAFFEIALDQRIATWNHAAELLYGYPTTEVIGRPIDFLCSPGGRTTLNAAPGEQAPRETVERHRHRNGSEILVNLRYMSSPDGLLVCAIDANSEQRAKTELAASRAALGSSRKELHRLGSKLLEAQEIERRRIARELHDDFKQRLGALGFELATLAQQFPSPQHSKTTLDSEQKSHSNRGPAERLEGLMDRVAELGDDIRRISHQLHPAALERLGLAAALQAHAAKIESRHPELEVRVTLHGTEGPLPQNTALSLFRIAQEALENVVRHADARQVHLTLVRARDTASVQNTASARDRAPARDRAREISTAETIRLAISDDGVGFDPDQAAGHLGLGLAGMEERARLLGGSLRLASIPGGGAEIEVTLTLDEAADDTSRPTPEAEKKAGRSSRLIGPYQLQEVLGEGAMATVYLAQEPPPLSRQLALKLYRAPLTGHREALSFKAERQALSKLRHPNIGSIHEARTTEDGAPYIVMEHVPGMPITAYCDRYRLDLTQRIELFITVCEAVRHIHQKGVLHRDLKPPNVLVMEQDGKAVPKILDFGIAKGLYEPLAEGTVWSQGAAGTPAYISPEVLDGGEADTRSDVYALGVMLYELLTGVLPAESEAEILGQLSGNSFHLPSRRLAAMPIDRVETSAANRRTSVRFFSRSLRGDLDWIVSRTLAPAPEHRYAGAADLAADLDRHLRDEPVLAGPPTLSYRLTRFARRHRAATTAAALALLALFGGLATTTWQARRAEQESLAAELARREAEGVTEFLEELFKVSDPRDGIGRTLTAHEILDRGTERLERELTTQPRVKARLQETVGNVYRLQGLHDTARPILEKSLELRRSLFGEQDLETARSLRALGTLHIDDGYFAKGRLLLEQALTIQEKALGENDLEVAKTLQTLALALRRENSLPEAAALYRRAYEIISSTLPPEHPRAILSLSTLGLSYRLEGDLDQALIHYQRAHELGEIHLGPDHPEVLMFLNSVANAYAQQGRAVESTAVFERMVPGLVRALGPQHPHTLNIRLNLATAYSRLGRTARAHEEAMACLEASQQALGLQGQLAMRAADLLGIIAYQRGEYERAAAFHRRSLEMVSTFDQPDDWSLEPKLDLIRAILAMGDLTQAELLVKSLQPLLAENSTPLHLSFGVQQVLADIAYAQGDLARTESLSRRLISDLETGPTTSDYPWEAARNRLRLGKVLAARGDVVGARESWQLVAKTMASRSHSARPRAWRATALLLLGRIDEARPIAQAALRGFRDPTLIKLCRQHAIEVPALDES